MYVPDAGRAASRALQRAGWLLHAHLVETKLQALRDAVENKYDPNQPRVPAGNPDGGQWTDGGGGTGGRLPSGPGTLLDVDDSESERTRLAQMAPRRGRGGTGRIQLGNGQFAQPTPAQAARYEFARGRADALLSQVRELDPRWSPRPSLRESVEGAIRALEAEAREAEAYLRELPLKGIGPGPSAGESIPARGPTRRFRVDERREINRIGRESGCHTCGNKDPGTDSGNFIPDHQLPNALNRSDVRQRLYPQCNTCSRRQGGTTLKLKRSHE
ncbi:MAG TPA: hypothetical protein VMW68_03990 [Methyloceanibacter sp.]|nr:hypothetical protein [Methyloceanibacter sp.]